jgi:hypothetical protein
MRRAGAAVVCVVLTGLVGLSASQDLMGSVSGLLTDTTGRGVPGATISVVSERMKFARLSPTRLVPITCRTERSVPHRGADERVPDEDR